MLLRLIKPLFLTIFLLIFYQSKGQKYSNEFLKIGAHASSMGLGNAVISSVTEGQAGYWNPAGLASGEYARQISAMHAEYFSGIANFDQASLAFKIDEVSGLAFNYIRFGIDNIPNTMQLIDPSGQINYANVTGFSSVDQAFLLSYGKAFGFDEVRFGATAKIIRRVAGNFAESWGFGIDIGAQQQLEKFGWGIVIRDVTSTFNAWKFNLKQYQEVLQSTGNNIPVSSIEITRPSIIGGLNYPITITEDITLKPEANITLTTDGRRNTLLKTKFFSLDPSFGITTSISDIVFIRGGLNTFQQVLNNDLKNTFSVQPSLGIGFKYNGIALDYALTNVGSGTQNQYSNYISLTINLNAK